MSNLPWLITVPHTGSYSVAKIFGGFENVFFKHFYEISSLDGAPKVYVPLRDPFEALISSVAREVNQDELMIKVDQQIASWRRLLAWQGDPRISFIRISDVPVFENISNPHPVKDAYAESQFKIARGFCVDTWDKLEILRYGLGPFLSAQGVFVGPWRVASPPES